MKKEAGRVLFFFNGPSLNLPDSIGLLLHISQIKKRGAQAEPFSPAEIFPCTVSILLKSLNVSQMLWLLLMDFSSIPAIYFGTKREK